MGSCIQNSIKILQTLRKPHKIFFSEVDILQSCNRYQNENNKKIQQPPILQLRLTKRNIAILKSDVQDTYQIREKNNQDFQVVC